jgi:hypothetical protein
VRRRLLDRVGEQRAGVGGRDEEPEEVGDHHLVVGVAAEHAAVGDLRLVGELGDDLVEVAGLA